MNLYGNFYGGSQGNNAPPRPRQKNPSLGSGNPKPPVGGEKGWFANLMNIFIPEPCHCTDAQGNSFTTQCAGNRKNQDCVACCGSLNGVPFGSGNSGGGGTNSVRRVR